MTYVTFDISIQLRASASHNHISDVMVSVLPSSAVDRGSNIGGVMVSVLPTSAVDRGSNIGGVMVSVLPSSAVDRGSNQRLSNWYLLLPR